MDAMMVRFSVLMNSSLKLSKFLKCSAEEILLKLVRNQDPVDIFRLEVLPEVVLSLLTGGSGETLDILFFFGKTSSEQIRRFLPNLPHLVCLDYLPVPFCIVKLRLSRSN